MRYAHSQTLEGTGALGMAARKSADPGWRRGREIMRQTMAYSLVMVGLMLLGCTSKQIAYVNDPKQWQHQYSTHATSCEIRARAVTGNATPSDAWYQEIFQQCMYKKGWSQVPEGVVR
jgi:hypothetical protein